MLKRVMACILTVILMALVLIGCSKNKLENVVTVDMGEELYTFENRTGTDALPNNDF